MWKVRILPLPNQTISDEFEAAWRDFLLSYNSSGISAQYKINPREGVTWCIR